MPQARGWGPAFLALIAVAIVTNPGGLGEHAVPSSLSAPRTGGVGATSVLGTADPSLAAAESSLALGQGPAASSVWSCRTAGFSSASCGPGQTHFTAAGLPSPTPSASWANPNASPPAELGAAMADDSGGHYIV